MCFRAHLTDEETNRVKLWSDHNNNEKYQFSIQPMQENIEDVIF